MPEWLLILVLVLLLILVGYVLWRVWLLERYVGKLMAWNKDVTTKIFWPVDWNKVTAAYPLGNGAQVPSKPPDFP
jgi:hypothetical protein